MTLNQLMKVPPKLVGPSLTNRDATFFIHQHLFYLTRSFLQASEIDPQIVTQCREQSKAPNTRVRLPLILDQKLKQKIPQFP